MCISKRLNNLKCRASANDYHISHADLTWHACEN